MKVLPIVEFAAKRRSDQDDMEMDLFPDVTAAMQRFPAQGWYNDLLAEVARLYTDTYHREGGSGTPRGTDTFVREVRDTLEKTESPDDNTVNRVSVWLATAILNAATMEAAGTDEDFVVLEWVTMHDSDVRIEHKDAEGQQQPPGETYDVGGEKMRYPGDPTASIKLWINCRCTLAPVLASETLAAASQREVAMTETIDEAEAVATPQMPLPWHGVLAPEGVWSGDKRMFALGSLRFRDLPLPLTWQKASGEGHDGSVTIAKIERIERIDNEMRATGHMLSTPEADEAVGLLAEFGRFGVSVDADDAEFEFDDESAAVTFTSARIASAAMLPIPAFAEAFVSLGEAPAGFMPDGEAEAECDPESPDYEACLEAKRGESEPAYAVTAGRGPGWITNPVETKRIHDYWTKPGEEGYVKIGWGVPGDFNRCRIEVGEEIAENSPEKVRFLNQICAQWHHDALGFWPGHAPSEQVASTFNGDAGAAVNLVASGGYCAPSEWFENPGFDRETPLTITEDGRVFGHLAGWKSCHTAYKGMCVAPPHSASEYAYFLTGYVNTTNGPVPVGQITLGGGHAPHNANMRAAIAHYDNTTAAAADVTCGEDDHGIWLAGMIRPGTSDETVYALRASSLSGDWRAANSPEDLELVAALAVNSPGFPVPRVGVESGRQVALVAAGVVTPGGDEGLDLEALAAQIEATIAARTVRRARLAELRKHVMEGAHDGV